MDTIHTLLIERDDTFRTMLLDLISGVDGIKAEETSETDFEHKIARKIDSFNPSAVLLGINALHSVEMRLFDQIRKADPYLPIIVMPRLDREGADVALTALKKGAVEYITKTRNRTGTLQTKEHIAARLIPVIKAVPRLNRLVLGSAGDVDTAITEIKRVSSDYFDRQANPMKLLVVVGCLGGVPALYLLLSSLPENLPVPVVVVQHMPKIYTGVFAEDLNRAAGLTVQEAEEGTELEAGQVYIAPGGYHAIVKSDQNRNYISLYRGQKVKGFRPSIDVFLRSVRNVYGNRALVTYLSGGGSDGVGGAEMIDIAGGRILVQNKSTSLLWDLPLKINIRGIDEGEYPLDRMGHEITRRLIS